MKQTKTSFKEKAPDLLSLIVCVLLTLAALCVGVRGGWERERAKPQDTYVVSSQEDWDALGRYAIACRNLATVAARHVDAGSAEVAALLDVYTACRNQTSADAASLYACSRRAEQAAQKLCQLLPTLASMQQSTRDQAYLAVLGAEASHAPDVFLKGWEQFNDSLQGSLTGRLAMLLGVRPFEREVAQQ